MSRIAKTPAGLPILSAEEFVTGAKEKSLPSDEFAVIQGFTAEVKTIKAKDGSARYRFIISTNGVDRDKDVVNVAGWNTDNYKKNPVVLFGHDYRSLPVGKCPKLDGKKNALEADVEFASAEIYPFADTVRRMVDGGFLRAASVGFKPIKYLYNEERRGIDIEEAELLEWSIVPVPANPECLVRLSAELDPAVLADFAKGCEQFLTACKGAGTWVESATGDLTASVDEPTPESASTIDEEAMIERIKANVLAQLKAEQEAAVKAAPVVEQQAAPAGFTLEDEDQYIFGVDLKAVTKTVREATKSALTGLITMHIKQQIDYARGRIAD
jgi:HK97 family phage prohead protease